MYKLSNVLKFPNVWNHIDKLHTLTPLNISECEKLCDTISSKLYQVIGDPSKLVAACLKLSSTSNVKKNLYLQLKRGLITSLKELEVVDSIIALEALGNFYCKGTKNITQALMYKIYQIYFTKIYSYQKR